MSGVAALRAAALFGAASRSTSDRTTLVIVVAAVVAVIAVALAAFLGRRSGRRSIAQRLTALGSRLGLDPPADDGTVETALSYLEQVTGSASEAVAESSADAMRLRRSLDSLPQGIVVCDESGTVIYRNGRANALMTSRHGDALAAQAVTELLEDAWDHGTAERTLDLYGPPRRTLAVRARLIDDGRRPLGVIAIIDDVSERRRLEEIRRDFVANVSHELKTPMGALGLLAETLVTEPDVAVARRLASRIQTEAFRVSRIIDDLLDLSRIESEEAPPREPVLVNLVMAEAVERVRASADQRRIVIELHEPEPPVAIQGDRRQLVSAMHALIENAVTYSYDGGVLTVSGRVVWADVDPGTNGAASSPVTPSSPALAGLGPVATTVVPATATGGVPATFTAPPAPPSVAAPSSTPATVGSGVAVGATTPDGTATAAATATATTAPGLPVASTVPAVTAAAATTAARPPGQESSSESAPARSGAPGPPAPWMPAGPPGRPPAGNESPPHDGSGETTPVPSATTAPPPIAPTVPGERAAERAADGTTGDDDGGRPPRDTVRITVTDRGIGIPARDLDRIFERFYRVDHGRSRETGGTGLGLSIVRHVASNHQGWVEVESREGEGSSFTLVLPLQHDRAN